MKFKYHEISKNDVSNYAPGFASCSGVNQVDGLPPASNCFLHCLVIFLGKPPLGPLEHWQLFLGLGHVGPGCPKSVESFAKTLRIPNDLLEVASPMQLRFPTGNVPVFVRPSECHLALISCDPGICL